jgi:CRP/FNR family transcriptional regulator, cyclic AMP receptor protein
MAWGRMKLMDHEARRRVLLSSPLFGVLPGEALDDILLQATEKFIRRGQTLYQKGDEGTYLVAVLSGRLRMSASSVEGREITLNMIDAGEVFGELALLDGKPRSADATALEDSTLMLVERRHFLPHMMKSNGLALRIIEMLCQRLRDTSEALGNFAMLDLPGRLARKLLNLAAEYGKPVEEEIRLDIRLSHSDLGRFVGCSRETVNKQMRAWEERGIVSREGGRITIRKPDALRRIAGQD